MDKFWWSAVCGLCLVRLSLAQIDLNITCRYDGVFHVEKNGRYSISWTEAADLCKAFNCTLPTMDQMEKARQAGFETCRYGFIEGHVVIPRINPNSICAANNTGVYVLTTSNTSQYDAYCFNASAPLGEDCRSVTDLPNAFDGPITITIVNRDGTRYTKKGEYRTNPEDILNNGTDDDQSSGFIGETSTPGDYNILHTSLPTVYPTQDQSSSWVSSHPGDIPITITSTVHTNSHVSAQEKINWIWSWFDISQPKNQDRTTAMTALMSTSGTTPKTATKRQEAQDWFSWLFQPSEAKNHLHTTTMTAGTDSNIISAGWEPTEENEDGRDKHASHSGSGIDDDEDFISSTISTMPRISGNPTQNQDWNQRSPSFFNPDVLLQTSTRTTDVGTSGTRDYGENWTQEPQSPLIHHEHRGEEETQHSTNTNLDSSHSVTLQPSADPNTGLVEDLDRTGPFAVTTQQSHTESFSTSHGGLEEDKDQPMTSTPSSGNRNLPEDSTIPVEGYTPHTPDTKEYTTLIPVTPANTGSPEVTEVTSVGDSNLNVDHSLSEDQDSSIDSHGKGRTTHGSQSAGRSSGSHEDRANPTSGPKRKAEIPEWLIILVSLLALALVLAVCIAVNSRRRCGQKKKLVINSGNGAVEDRKPSGLNGEASKSQEMVHLVNKEPSETTDQLMTADETRNLQNEDTKAGV